MHSLPCLVKPVQSLQSLICALWARRQTATSRNTGEAETIALDDGTFHEAIPLQGLLEEVTGRAVRVIAESGDQQSIAAVSALVEDDNWDVCIS